MLGTSYQTFSSPWLSGYLQLNFKLLLSAFCFSVCLTIQLCVKLSHLPNCWAALDCWPTACLSSQFLTVHAQFPN